MPNPMMRRTVWIWFLGFAAWVLDAIVSVHLHDWLHARLAIMVAIVFLAAGLFYRRQT
jgi:hypothetical protein